jgi:hypothetical protein
MVDTIIELVLRYTKLKNIPAIKILINPIMLKFGLNK